MAALHLLVCRKIVTPCGFLPKRNIPAKMYSHYSIH